MYPPLNDPVPPHRELELTLDDGRALTGADYGPDDGRPILLFHGLPGSRLQMHPDLEIIAKLGLRIITCDRPGMGGSTPLPGRRFRDWAGDARQFIDHLGLGEIGLIGVSGGGPYALACAAAFGERIPAMALVSPMAPMQRPGARRGMNWPLRAFLRIVRVCPRLVGRGARFVIEHQVADRRVTRNCIGRLVFPPADLEIISRPEIGNLMDADFQEATRQGVEGPLLETRLLLSPWDLNPAEIDTPTIIWHGNADTIVPSSHGQWLAQTMPHASFTPVPGGGHFMVYEELEPILQALLKATTMRPGKYTRS